MSALLLYEIASEPRSPYLNAIEILRLDTQRELFLSDILGYFATSPTGCNFSFYVVIGDRLVWLDSPTSLVPVCPDGAVRMVLKPATFPPFIHVKQLADFADKSRIQLYSRNDYERTRKFAYRTIQDASRVAMQYQQQRQTRENHNTSQSSANNNHNTSHQGNNSGGLTWDDSQSDATFANFDAHFSASNPPGEPSFSYRDEVPQHQQQQRQTSHPKYADRPDNQSNERSQGSVGRRSAERYSDSYSDYPSEHTARNYEDDRRFTTSSNNTNRNNNGRPNEPRYQLDHPRKNSASSDHNLNSYVGEDTAAALTDAAEAVGVAAKSFFSFATTLSKSVLELAQTGTSQVGLGVVNSGTPSKLYAGAIVQVGRMAVSVIRELAEGGFGMVYLVEDCAPRGQRYALKQLLCQSREQVEEAHHELDVLRRFQGRSNGNIIELLEYTGAGGGEKQSGHGLKQVLMLFPLYPRGTLWDQIVDGMLPETRSWPFPEPVALYIIMCAAEALQVLHTENLAHRDVKPHNFLLEDISPRAQQSRGVPSSLHPVLMDLGSVTTARVPIRNKREALKLEEEAASKTSAAYRSPELTSPPFPPFQVDERVDTWGLGCTMFCLAYGRSPFETAKEGVLRLAILNGKYGTPPGNRNKDCVYSEEYMRLIERMLKVDISERPYVEEIIRECQSLLAKYN